MGLVLLGIGEGLGDSGRVVVVMECCRLLSLEWFEPAGDVAIRLLYLLEHCKEHLDHSAHLILSVFHQRSFHVFATMLRQCVEPIAIILQPCCCHVCTCWQSSGDRLAFILALCVHS